ncbi:HNH endonuclease [Pseudomonas sp. X10]
MAVWVIAAGGLNDPTAIENYDKTLTAPISQVRLQALPPQVTVPQGDLYAWGFPKTAKGGNERKFDEIAVGDICFFCTTRCEGPKASWTNAYRWVAKVSGLFRKPDAAAVSRAFWDSDDFFPYLLERPIPIDVSFQAFSKEINPAGIHYARSPQNSTKLVDPAKLRNVIDRYGSVDNWAEDYMARLAQASLAGNERTRRALEYTSRLPAMRHWLIALAKAHGTVSYMEIAEVFGITDRFTLEHSMELLAEQALALNEPIITALIIGTREESSSDGLPKFGIEDEERERLKLYAYWSDKEFLLQPAVQGESLEAKAARFACVEIRPDQAAFRRKVFTAFGGRCAISGCAVERALDAAHRHGKKWRQGDNNASDGLLLRKDLHALYDSHLLTISEDGLIGLAEDVVDYYTEFNGRKVAMLE